MNINLDGLRIKIVKIEKYDISDKFRTNKSIPNLFIRTNIIGIIEEHVSQQTPATLFYICKATILSKIAMTVLPKRIQKEITNNFIMLSLFSYLSNFNCMEYVGLDFDVIYDFYNCKKYISLEKPTQTYTPNLTITIKKRDGEIIGICDKNKIVFNCILCCSPYFYQLIQRYYVDFYRFTKDTSIVKKI